MTHPVNEGITAARRSAVHLEMRDAYAEDEEFARWRSGHRYEGDPARLPQWWWPWHETVTGATARGVVMRRARIVSEPVSDYIGYEHDMTFANTAAGELVRWLPRRRAADIALPGTDFWLFDGGRLLLTYFSGDGRAVDREWCTDPATVALAASAFEVVWERAVPHEEYKPVR
ncbi:DUF6879 family protein [Streptomyces sp. NPDC059835]|uniref:DUF6879 family protein n=1 Tax=Streptomyces sp. NPDC059835 TaxID=3346967 RepID=UPI00364D0743